MAKGPTQEQLDLCVELEERGFRVRGPTIHEISNRVVIDHGFTGSRVRKLEAEFRLTPSGRKATIVERK